jgi:glycosyltransferase involved in cell wall biosynthesis
MHHGDAITHDAMAIRNALRRAGYASDIFCNPEHLHPGMRREAKDFQTYGGGPSDVMIYHCSIATPLTDWYIGLKARRFLRYHNITPAEHFRGVEDRLAIQLAQGRMELPRIAEATEHAICVSSFNAEDFHAIGFERTSVLPIVMDTAAFDEPPDQALLARLREDHRKKILFVGRIVPNKCPDDLLRVMAVIQRAGRVEAALHVVGSPGSALHYHHRVVAMRDHLELEECAHFAGHVSQAELLAHFHAADLFLCLSEHEGFCVPLIEAMHHGIPIVAHAAGAIPETLGDAGLLVGRKHPPAIAELVEVALTDEALRARLRERGMSRVAAFSPEVVERRFMELVKALVG